MRKVLKNELRYGSYAGSGCGPYGLCEDIFLLLYRLRVVNFEEYYNMYKVLDITEPQWRSE